MLEFVFTTIIIFLNIIYIYTIKSLTKDRENTITSYCENNSDGRFFITGDKHRKFDEVKKFCRKMKTRRKDILIILGDAGFNYYGDDRDSTLKKKISKLEITLFCIHGNKENRPQNVGTYGVRSFCGGKVYYEPKYPNIFFAIDGEIYTFEGKQYMVVGGAHSVDRLRCLEENLPFWHDEMPDDTIKEKVELRLHSQGNKNQRSSISVNFEQVENIEPEVKQVPEVIEEEELPAQPEPKKNVVRSSIALFVPENLQNGRNAPVLEGTNDLFQGSDDLYSDSYDGSFKPDVDSITSPESTMYSDDESPPPIEIDMVAYDKDQSQLTENTTQNEQKKEEEPKEDDENVRKKKAKQEKKIEKDVNIREEAISEPDAVEEVSPYFGQYPQRVAATLENGMKTLTKNQVEQIEIFKESLHRRIESFKEDLKNSVKEREIGSMNQLNTSKVKFLENIQSFKRREAGIHQSLLSYEESTKTIAQKLSLFQKSIKQEVHKHKQTLEEELSKLRKMIGQDDESESDDFESEI